MSDYAFPRPGSMYNEAYVGMTLRDYFAGQVLAGIVPSMGYTGSIVAAELAYEYADAMLKERGGG